MFWFLLRFAMLVSTLMVLGYNAINKGTDNIKSNWLAYAIAMMYVLLEMIR